mmetsp:Transcript_41088/g.95514  ORF Transcript_41088/g.95514 Transcript_41088/m.95514 type:complete len:587 (-) Transcript_41088:39-1799(-)
MAARFGLAVTAFIIASNGARLVNDKDKVALAAEVDDGAATSGRYQAYNASGIHAIMEGADLPLFLPPASSLAEDQEILGLEQLPREWASKLKIVAKLGEGSFGKVYKCQVLCQDGPAAFVSVKLITKKDREVLREIKVLETMKGISDFCISAVGTPSFVDNSQGYWLMMPYMNHGDLQDFIRSCEKSSLCMRSQPHRKAWEKLDPDYSTPYVLALFHDIVQGMYMLKRVTGMLHTDLKPANVMMNCVGKRCFAAVIDLGLVCDPARRQCTQSGTPIYMPAEVWRASQTGLQHVARDVWALGIILYQLLYTSDPPFFRVRSTGEIMTKVARYNPETDRNIPTPRKQQDKLVIKMLNPDYRKRPSLEDILNDLKEIVGTGYYPVPKLAMQMLTETPAERGASVKTPECLTATAAKPAPPAPSAMPAPVPGERPRAQFVRVPLQALREPTTTTPPPTPAHLMLPNELRFKRLTTPWPLRNHQPTTPSPARLLLPDELRFKRLTTPGPRRIYRPSPDQLPNNAPDMGDNYFTEEYCQDKPVRLTKSTALCGADGPPEEYMYCCACYVVQHGIGEMHYYWSWWCGLQLLDS